MSAPTIQYSFFDYPVDNISKRRSRFGGEVPVRFVIIYPITKERQCITPLDRYGCTYLADRGVYLSRKPCTSKLGYRAWSGITQNLL